MKIVKHIKDAFFSLLEYGSFDSSKIETRNKICQDLKIKYNKFFIKDSKQRAIFITRKHADFQRV